MFHAVFCKQRGWRVYFNELDICGAIDELVARMTAAEMNAYRARNP